MLQPRVVIGISVLICIMHANWSSASDLNDGTYIREGDTGTLVIKKADNGNQTFQLDTTGANGHSCSVDGLIKKGIGYDSDEATCHIAFKNIAPSKISVEPITDEECSGYCGMRANLDGEYVIPPVSCTHKSVQERRNHYLKLYRGRNYKGADAAAKSLLSECEHFIDWVTVDDIRNDLAIAQYHEGDYSACLQTLSDTVAAQYANENEVKENLPPSDADWYSRVAGATFYNKALCSKSSK